MKNNYADDPKFAVPGTIQTHNIPKFAIPLELFMQEAEELYVWVQDDRKQLEKAGLDWNIIEDLPNRTALCRETQTKWNTYRLAQTETRKRLNLLVARAWTMKNNLIHALRYALRNDTDAVRCLRAIGKETRQSGLVQALYNLSDLCEDNANNLAAIGFPLEQIGPSAELSGQLSRYIASAAEERSERGTIRLRRDRAFVHCKQAVDAIRACGKYVFQNEPQRLKGYASRYRRKKKHNPLPAPPATPE